MTVVEGKVIEKVNEVEETLLARTTPNPFKGKWISILGGSASTFEGWIPSGNNSHYPNGYIDDDVTQTWWHQLITKLGAKLCVNASYAGICVCSNGASSMLVEDAQLHREPGTEYINIDGTTTEATERQDPDIILIDVGIVDFNNGIPAGTQEFTPGEPTERNSFYSSLDTNIYTLINNYPNAAIYMLNIPYCGMGVGFMKQNKGGSRLCDYRAAIENCAKVYEFNVLHVNRIGVNGINKDEYTIVSGEPNEKMMTKIANQCYNEMMASNCL